MSLAFTVLLFMGMLLVALLLEPVAARLRIPAGAMLVAAGFGGVSLLVGMGIDTGLRWYHFHDLVFFLLLPVLIYRAAFHMDPRLLLRSLVPVLLLSVPVVLFSALLTGALLFAGIDHPTGFPWLTALVAGVLLCTVEPFTDSGWTRRVSVSPRLQILLEGESLFSDSTTIVLFLLLLGLATGRATAADWPGAVTGFLLMTGGGLGVGLLAGVGAAWMLRRLNRALVVTLVTAWGSYLVAENLCGVSGVMAALASGLVTGSAAKNRMEREQLAELEHWWTQLGWIATSTLFLLAGATFTLTMFEQRWLAMLIGIAAALAGRGVGVWMAATLTGRLPGQQPLPPAERTLLVFGGVRGAITLALALSLPFELEGWWTVQSIAYGVVFFSLFIQAPLLQRYQPPRVGAVP